MSIERVLNLGLKKLFGIPAFFLLLTQILVFFFAPLSDDQLKLFMALSTIGVFALTFGVICWLEGIHRHRLEVAEEKATGYKRDRGCYGG